MGREGWARSTEEIGAAADEHSEAQRDERMRRAPSVVSCLCHVSVVSTVYHRAVVSSGPLSALCVRAELQPRGPLFPASHSGGEFISTRSRTPVSTDRAVLSHAQRPLVAHVAAEFFLDR